MEDLRFIARVMKEINNGPSVMKSLEIGVFEVRDGVEKQVGAYVRSYHKLYRTFYHFRKRGKDYALYSLHYTATRVMELPSCKDIGGEAPDTAGFCPVDFYVPWQENEEEYFTADFGFVAGCKWGDDNSWKIQFLDLSQVEKGVIKRDDRFGYIALPEKCTLEQAVSMWYYNEPDEPYISIATQKVFDLQTGKTVWE